MCIRDRVTTPQQRLASDDDSWSRPGKSSFGNPGDDLAAQTLPVERALAGDDEVGGLHQRTEADRVKHRLHPTDPMSPQHHQAVAQASGGARSRLAFESYLLAGEQVPAGGNTPANDLGEVAQCSLELLRHLRCRALLGRIDRTCALESEQGRVDVLSLIH